MKRQPLSIALAWLLGLALIACGVLSVDNQRTSASPPSASGDSRHVTLLLDISDSISGTDSSTIPLWGYIKAVYLDYSADVSDTTDITLTTALPASTIMVLTDIYTDGWYYPSVQFTDNAGAAVSGAYGKFPIEDYVIASADETTASITITVYYGQ